VLHAHGVCICSAPLKPMSPTGSALNEATSYTTCPAPMTLRSTMLEITPLRLTVSVTSLPWLETDTRFCAAAENAMVSLAPKLLITA
jgi:hypothetical protein